MNAWRNVWTITKRELAAYFTSPLAYVFIVIFLLLCGFFIATVSIRRDVNVDLFVGARDLLVGLSLIGGAAIAMRSIAFFPKERPDAQFNLLEFLNGFAVMLEVGVFLGREITERIVLSAGHRSRRRDEALIHSRSSVSTALSRSPQRTSR